MKTATVLGGGIIGLTCALRLMERGWSVTLIDRQGAPGASLGNAGHLAVEQVEPLASLKTALDAPRRLFAMGGPLDLPLRAAPAWIPFVAAMLPRSGPRGFAAGVGSLTEWLAQAMPAWRRLASTISVQNLLLEQGHFIVWESQASAARETKAWASLGAETASFRSATQGELSEIEKRTGLRPAAAIRFDKTGQIADLAALVEALRETLRAGGARLLDGEAAQIEIVNGAARLALSSGETHDADLILIAAGAASGRLLKSAGVSAPVIAERGYHIEGACAGWPEYPPVAFADRAVIATRFARALRLASFVEFAAPETPADPAKWRRLRKHAQELGIEFTGPVSEWMGARPTLPDYLPAIGRSQEADNLFYAFGHQHLGLTLAPLTAEAIAALASGEEPICNAAPFDLRRFA